MDFIDGLLNRITMYRLMFYYLLVLYIYAVILSLLRVITFDPLNFLLPGIFITIICVTTNYILSRLYKVSSNFESQFITALILVLIIGPLSVASNILLLTLASVLAISSKFIIVYKKQHFFNPAAFGVVGTALIMNQGSSWWVGDKFMLPLIIIGGLLILRKLNRFHVVISFFFSLSISLILFQDFSPDRVYSYIFNPATLFFSFIMLTEPITSPASKKFRIIFGLITGFLIVIYQTYLGVFYILELALLSANLIGRIISFSSKYQLKLLQKREIGTGIWEYLFTSNHQIKYMPGQYLEWTLPHPNMDSRGMRRYFTIASSPSEKDILLAVKIPQKPSSFKKALTELKTGDHMFATNLEGEFVLNKDKNLSLVFIAGGIGITPFRSIIKYILDNNLTFKITLFYLAHDAGEFVYEDLFTEAERKLGLKFIKVISENPPNNWNGETGRLTDSLLQKYVEDYKNQHYYISGPQLMVTAYKKLLIENSVSRSNIKTDYFPGYEANDR